MRVLVSPGEHSTITDLGHDNTRVRGVVGAHLFKAPSGSWHRGFPSDAISSAKQCLARLPGAYAFGRSETTRELEAVWSAETTTNRDRKRLLRCLIEEVQLLTEADHYQVRIVWNGGAAVDRRVKRLKPGTAHRTTQETVELVRKLAEQFDDAQIARILNRQGRRTGFGNPFTKAKVCSLRGHHKIPKCPRQQAKDPREGPFTADEAASELGVCTSTLHRWVREGVLAGEQATPGAPWRIILTEEVRGRLTGGDAPAGWVGLSEAARRLGRSKASVAHLVNTGKLPAVRTTVGRKQVWRIDVSSNTYQRQMGLYEDRENDAPGDS